MKSTSMLTEMVFILDRSGSMTGLEDDTIGGFNSLIQRQKKEDGDAVVTTVLFDTASDVVYDRVPLDEVPRMTEYVYRTGGCTALLDTLGKMIERIRIIQNHLPAEYRPDKTIVVVITDGKENTSRLYDQHTVRQMIERQQKKDGWEFLFLGANMDAVMEAGHLGIRPERAVEYVCDEEGTAMNFRAVSHFMSCARCMDPLGVLSETDDEWKKDIEQYARSQKKGNRNG